MTDGEIKALFEKSDDENNRQNQRIGKLENQVEKITSLAMSIERMATSIEHMTDELKTQGIRIANLEQKPADRWEKIINAVLTAVVGVFIGWLIKGA